MHIEAGAIFSPGVGLILGLEAIGHLLSLFCLALGFLLAVLGVRVSMSVQWLKATEIVHKQDVLKEALSATLDRSSARFGRALTE